MGTYTTNYNLFMPTVGEQGWGTLVNENFTTIDTTMAGLNTRLTAVESEVNGNLSCTSVTTSGKLTANGGIGTTSLTTSSTITSTGLITANGGVTGFLFIKGNVQMSGDEEYAKCAVQTGTITATSASAPSSIKINGYSISYPNPKKHIWGVYTRRSDLTGTTSPSLSTRSLTVNLKCPDNDPYTTLYYKKSTDTTWSNSGQLTLYRGTTVPVNITATVGATYQFYFTNPYGYNITATINVPEVSTKYYVKYATP